MDPALKKLQGRWGNVKTECDKGHRKQIKCLEARRGKDTCGFWRRWHLSWALIAREMVRNGSPGEEEGEGRQDSGVHWGLQEQDSCSSVDLKPAGHYSPDFEPILSPLGLSATSGFHPHRGEQQGR